MRKLSRAKNSRWLHYMHRHHTSNLFYAVLDVACVARSDADRCGMLCSDQENKLTFGGGYVENLLF